jgi:hypothetical protein
LLHPEQVLILVVHVKDLLANGGYRLVHFWNHGYTLAAKDYEHKVRAEMMITKECGGALLLFHHRRLTWCSFPSSCS